MKTNFFIKKHKTLTYFLLCTLSLTAFSCSKDDDSAPKEEEYQAKVMLKDGETERFISTSSTKGTEGLISRQGDVYAIRDFRQGKLNTTGTAIEMANAVFYFNFKENDGMAESDAQLVLNATQRNMDLIPNIKNGYKLSYIDKAFSEVKPTDQLIPIEKAGVSLGSGIGWANYDFTIHHVVAAENRTFILSKDEKVLFKFRINSAYSGGKPNAERESTNYVFYSIDYQEFK